MDNPSILLHPDALNDRRFLMGHRLQMKPSGTSHKKKSCSFHDLDKSKQGVLISSMNQEALQVTRKFKTIQKDKLRGFPTSFLANSLQDYFHNLKKCKDKEKKFKKMVGFVEIKRDKLTKRAIIITQDENK